MLLSIANNKRRLYDKTQTKEQRFCAKLLTYLIIVSTTLWVTTTDAFAVPKYRCGISYVTNWNNCDNICIKQNKFSYLKNVITNATGVMLKSNDWLIRFKLSNEHTYPLYIISPNYGGKDYYFADSVDLYIHASHGTVMERNISGINYQEFVTQYCTTGYKPNEPVNISYSSDLYDNCSAESSKIMLGESALPYTDNTVGGKLRWLILETCHSIQDRPHQAYRNLMGYGVDMIMGYRDNDYTGRYNQDKIAVFLKHSMVGNGKFKQNWFNAVDDWYTSNIPSVFTCDAKGDKESSKTRLNNYHKAYLPRKHDGSRMTCSWSWHKHRGINGWH